MIDRSLMYVEVEANDADALYPQLLARQKSAECDACIKISHFCDRSILRKGSSAPFATPSFTVVAHNTNSHA